VSKRTYAQYCGLAKALDVLGERWTLLIIRELLPGPRRYRDISAQLPDLATDMLTARLRMLTDHGLVARTETGGVGGGVTYSLTPQGQSVRPVVEQLALVGLNWMVSPRETNDDITLRWALATVRIWLDPAQCPAGACAFITDDQTFALANDGLNVALTYEPDATDPPTVMFRGTDFDLVALITGHVPFAASSVTRTGDQQSGDRWLDALATAFPKPIAARGEGK
jgi:DNA-binding HxlR family transcriptional regulator